MKIVALAGGVGGAKMAHGLAQILLPDELTVVVNTGDDFDFLGLRICPDLDTVCYTLAGLANPDTGWGRAHESWNAMANLVALGGPDWFQLGDQDLGTHLERTRRISAGSSLSSITRDFCAAWGIRHTVLPMTDDSVATWVDAQDIGWLSFQEYFVRERCAPKVLNFEFRGIDQAQTAPGVENALVNADWIVICPSNPWVSIGPILGTKNIRTLIRDKPIIIISPIIGGKAIKGPAAKMYAEMGMGSSVLSVAEHYISLLDEKLIGKPPGERNKKLFFVIDTIDSIFAPLICKLGIRVVLENIFMNSIEDRKVLAGKIIKIIEEN